MSPDFSLSSSGPLSSEQRLLTAAGQLADKINGLLQNAPDLQTAIRRRAGAMLHILESNGLSRREQAQPFLKSCCRGEFLLVPEDWSAIVARGEHQIVVALPGQLVAKLETTDLQSSSRTDIPPGYLPVAEKGYLNIEETWATLEHAFTPIVRAVTGEHSCARLLPEIATLCLSCYVRADAVTVTVSTPSPEPPRPDGQNLNVCITRDLREDGYLVQEFDKRLLDGLPADNAREIRILHRELLRCMVRMWEAQRQALSRSRFGGPYLDYMPHRTRRQPLEAISSMFFLRTKNGVGELVIGDLDHIRASESVRLGV